MISESELQQLQKKPTRNTQLHVTEESEQMAVLAFVRLYSVRFPELSLLFHVPNGGSRHILEAKKLRQLGVKSGVPDLCMPIARGGYNAMWIEMKSKSGRLRPEQSSWIAALTREGGYVRVCHGAQEAIDTILHYLQLPKSKKEESEM